MARTVTTVVLLLVWVGFFVTFVVRELVVDLLSCSTSVLEDTPRSYLWMGAGMLVWGALGMLIPGALSLFSTQFWRPASALLLVAAVNGGFVGRAALNLVNGFGDSSPGLPARFEVTQRWRGSNDIRLIAPYPGTTFNVPGRDMRRLAENPDKRFVVHRGRLGLLWGEFV